jgi:hypothetical protein
MHTGEAHLDESDYDDYINDFKDIELINGETNGTCTNEIEEIHDTHFDTRKVERIVVSYKKYVEIELTVHVISVVTVDSIIVNAITVVTIFTMAVNVLIVVKKGSVSFSKIYYSCVINIKVIIHI